MRRSLPLLALLSVSTAGFPAPSRMDTLMPGESRAGRLEAGDATLPSGEFRDAWGFIGTAGQRVTVDVTSEDFDTYLILVRPDGTQMQNDDGGEGTNSRLSQRLRAEGRYGVIVTSYSAGETGSYTLSVREGLAAAAPDPQSFEVEAPVTPIALGHRAAGQLAEGDSRQVNGRFVDEFTFEGEIGWQVTIGMESEDIDCHLTLIHPGGERTVNDDVEPGNLDSRIEIVLPATGEYRLRASSYAPDTAGPYALSVMDTTRRLALDQPVQSRFEGREDEVTYLLDEVPDDLGLLEIALTGGGPDTDLDLEVLSPGRDGQPWVSIARSALLGAEERVVIPANGVHPRLVHVTAPAGEGLEYLVHVRTRAGEVHAGVPAVLAGELTLRESGQLQRITPGESGYLIARLKTKGGSARLCIDGAGPRREVDGEEATMLVPVSAGQPVALGLSPTGLLGPGGLEYRLTAQMAEQRGQLTLGGGPLEGFFEAGQSSAVCEVSGVVPGALRVIADSLTPGATAPALTLFAEGAGRPLAESQPVRLGGAGLLACADSSAPHLLLLTRDDVSRAASFRLSVEQGDVLSVSPLTPGVPERVRLGRGGVGASTWRMGAVPGGLHRFTARTGEGSQAALRLEVWTRARDGARWICREDRAEAGETAEVVLCPEGTETWVTVYHPSLDRDVEVTVEVEALTPAPLAAGAADEAEMWGLFVGVSEYPGGRDNLPHCDDDAINLHAAFVRQSALRPDHAVVLTDAQATRAAIRAAFEALEGRVGPGDTFVFLFSGHGGQRTFDEGLFEPDGLDEFFCPHDSDEGGDIHDDEFDAWIGALGAQLSLILIDSCNSGGFRDELTNRRGRVVMLASEEDLLSYTYERYKAGGILAHTAMRGVQGEADLDGDGDITVGELSDFVLTQMPTIAISDDEHSGRLAQHPVSSRTVPYETVLLTLPE